MPPDPAEIATPERLAVRWPLSSEPERYQNLRLQEKPLNDRVFSHLLGTEETRDQHLVRLQGKSLRQCVDEKGRAAPNEGPAHAYIDITPARKQIPASPGKKDNRGDRSRNGGPASPEGGDGDQSSPGFDGNHQAAEAQNNTEQIPKVDLRALQVTIPRQSRGL